MDKDTTLRLKEKFEALLKEEPFNGKVNHRTRAAFIAKWKEIVQKEGVFGDSWVNDLLKAMGK